MNGDEAQLHASTNGQNSSGRWLIENNDIDSDGDGLTDFQEIHKYFTDPNKADTDGDGIPDGDWSERREYAYTVRNEIEILKPVDIAAMQSDYQDAKIIEDRGKSLLIEVIYYPLNTVEKGISANKNWREDYKDMQEYLKPSQTSNWDESMRTELLRSLSLAGINPAQLSDKELVERVSAWVMSSFKGDAPFVAYFVDIADGKAKLIPELLPRLKSDNQDNPTFDLDHLDDMLRLGTFGKTLFTARKIGSCTPSAILISTVLRALGIPTRIILTVPVIDTNDDVQQGYIASKITHPIVKDTINAALGSLRGWNSHTYNEVFVGKRWVKLNYSKLGQNNLDAGYFGLMTHVNTFVDWSDGNMGRTWGMRIADAEQGRLNPALSSQNQYMSHSLSDLFGVHAHVIIPTEHKNLTIDGVYWPHDSRLTPGTRDINFTATTGKIFLTSFKEYFPDQDYKQYGRFYVKSPRKIQLVADGQRTIIAELAVGTGYYTDSVVIEGKERISVIYPFMISNADFDAMPSGVLYQIQPINDAGAYTLSVQSGVTFRK